ncbi:MAG: phosphoglucosamine mutase [Candidatus Kapabacteria bacterium]|nr:phosphoglucosamine mutase [Ignavibacteriota bacterium]MCW5884653.1 phosphoglucosamine mutase [Candidatus Kapabacteria bacterium]
MMPFIRSISGLRATLGDGLKPCLLAQYAYAFAETIPIKKVVIGRDGRPSGKWIESVITGALVAAGCQVRQIGMAPTPTVQLEVEHSNAGGGIAITASHNPGIWNGLKFINSQGIFLDAEENYKLWKIVDQQTEITSNESLEFYDILHDKNAQKRHIKIIADLDFIKKNIRIIRNRKLKVVVDAVNASGSYIVPELLREFGCEVIDLNCDGSGIFPHTPEPLPENLLDLANTVRAVKADLGLAVDPDADRLVLIDENGNPIGEEKTIALCVESLLRTSDKRGNIVINLSTSSMTEIISSKYGCKTLRSPVGEINVVKLMKESIAIIGGEGSGGVILPECHYGRDSMVGIALVLNLLAESKKTLSELSSELPNLIMVKKKKDFTGSLDELFNKLQSKYSGFEITMNDGIRIDFDNKWVQLRASNTEPIVRVIAEAENQSDAQVLADEIMDLVN